MKNKTKTLRVLLITLFCSVIFYVSCKKDITNSGNNASNKVSKMSAQAAIEVKSWAELRDQTREEFDFNFRSYYHTRDFLGQVDWDRAILSELDGKKCMVFRFNSSYSKEIDAKLMVQQNDDGSNIYMIRVKTIDSKYVSVYTANDKTLHLGELIDNKFNEIGSTLVVSQPLGGTFPRACQVCHSGSSGGDNGWGESSDPVPGGGTVSGDNWLGDVVIVDQRVDWNWTWTSKWDGPIVIIPQGGGTQVTKDSNPCNKFQNLMNNPSVLQALQTLASNTTLNRETAFYFNGTQISPFANGVVGGDAVDIVLPADAELWGHSHYPGKLPTFSDWDLQTYYNAAKASANPMGFVGVVATPDGMSMIKITDMTLADAFYSNYLSTTSGLNMLGGLMNSSGAGPNGGASAANALNNLLNTLSAGMKVTKVDPQHPQVNCN